MANPNFTNSRICQLYTISAVSGRPIAIVVFIGKLVNMWISMLLVTLLHCWGVVKSTAFSPLLEMAGTSDDYECLIQNPLSVHYDTLDPGSCESNPAIVYWMSKNSLCHKYVTYLHISSHHHVWMFGMNVFLVNATVGSCLLLFWSAQCCGSHE